MGWQYPLHTIIACPKAKGFTDPGPSCTCNRCCLHMIPAADGRHMKVLCAMTMVAKAHNQTECPGEVKTPQSGRDHRHLHGLSRHLLCSPCYGLAHQEHDVWPIPTPDVVACCLFAKPEGHKITPERLVTRGGRLLGLGTQPPPPLPSGPT